MRPLIKHNDTFYLIHREVRSSTFMSKEGKLDEEKLNQWKDGMIGVDHVLKRDEIFLFVQTVTDAVIEE